MILGDVEIGMDVTIKLYGTESDGWVVDEILSEGRTITHVSM
jgi:hypothetical protein